MVTSVRRTAFLLVVLVRSFPCAFRVRSSSNVVGQCPHHYGGYRTQPEYHGAARDQPERCLGLLG